MISRACARALAPRYTAAKMNMSMYALGMAEEFRDARRSEVAQQNKDLGRREQDRAARLTSNPRPLLPPRALARH